MECYDPSTDDWTFVTEMEKARSGLSLIAIDHNIYMIGGRYKTADQYFDVAERYGVKRIIILKGRGPGINSSQSKNVGKIQLSMQLSHLNIIFENIWF